MKSAVDTPNGRDHIVFKKSLLSDQQAIQGLEELNVANSKWNGESPYGKSSSTVLHIIGLICLSVQTKSSLLTDCYFLLFSRRYFKDMPQIALDKKSNFEYIE